MFYFTLPVDSPCKAYPARCLASFTCSQEGWRVWEKELPFCASLCLGKKKPWKQFTEPYRDHVQQPCCLAVCPKWEWCFLSWSSSPPIQTCYPLVGSSGETSRHCSSEGPCPSCFLLENQETFCLKKHICQIFTARQLVEAFALLFQRVS